MSAGPSQKDEQLARFVEIARALGCDEDEAAFDEKLKGIVKTKPALRKSEQTPVAKKP